MIKKLLWLSVFCLLWLGFVFANPSWYTRQIWVYWYNPYFNSFDIKISSDWTPFTDSLWIEKKIFSLYSDNNITYHSWFWYDWLPYVYYNYWNGVISQWTIKYYYICDELLWNEISKPWNCILYNIDENSKSVFSSFVSSITDQDFYFFRQLFDYNRWQFCFSSFSIWNSLCFDLYSQWSSLDNELWLPVYDFWSFNTDVLQNSPWFSNWWNDYIPWIALWSDESAVNYFEKNYWRDENICYVWVNNTTDLYWSSVSFNKWSWLTIFEVFNNIYWNTDLDKVYVWLNTWLINYNQWFNYDSPSYLASYNSWNNVVDLYFDNLSFPFLNNPVAYYFMTDNIFDYFNATEWSEIVSYCNLKVNNWSYEDILDQSTKNNINNYTENSNINIWLNPDWSDKVLPGPSQNLSSWNIIEWVSRESMQYSWDVNFENFFDHALDEIKRAIDTVWVNPFTWVLPNYIIFGFLLVVLFKVLRK